MKAGCRKTNCCIIGNLCLNDSSVKIRSRVVRNIQNVDQLFNALTLSTFFKMFKASFVLEFL